MPRDKRERHRLKRAAKKVQRARQVAHAQQQRVRHDRAVEHAYAAQALLEAGDARGAVTAAAEAASA